MITHMDYYTILLIVVLSFIVNHAELITREPCKKVKVDGNWYKSEILMSNLGRPHNLIFHKTEKVLFFSHSISNTYSGLDFQISYFQVEIKQLQHIKGITGGCAVAIDQINGEIFVGGSDGIYTYSLASKTSKFYKEKSVNIWSLVFKKNLFYISYPDQKLRVEIKGKFASITDFDKIEIDHFHVTSNNNIFYANKTGLYTYDHYNRTIDLIDDTVVIRQIAEDNKGELYFCTNFGIYRSVGNRIKRVYGVRNIHGLSFDQNNNLIIADDKKIMRFTPSNIGCDDDDVNMYNCLLHS